MKLTDLFQLRFVPRPPAAALLAVIALTASAAERTANLPGAGEQALREASSTLRVVAGVPKVTPDSATASLHLEGTEDQLAVADWMLAQIDAGQTKDYSDTVRVFRVPQNTTGQSVQQLMANLRSEFGIRTMFHYSDKHLLFCRGTAEQLDKTAGKLFAKE